MQHNPALKDFNEFSEKQNMINNVKTAVNFNESEQTKNATGTKSNFFRLAKNQN